jgi:hypothetical protein
VLQRFPIDMPSTWYSNSISDKVKKNVAFFYFIA